MKAPVSWIREQATLPEGTTTDQIARALNDLGLELEAVERGGAGISGPVVVGRVLSLAEEPQKNGKTIRWCTVDVGAEHNPADEPGRGIVCGAANFAVGDLVVAALPGAELPGGFAIAARKTYGHVSDGMLCAEDELGLGSDHAGILILPSEVGGQAVRPGDDALDVLGAREDVLDLGVTPDMGYCQSIRGLAREVAQRLGGTFRDPIPPRDVPATQDGYPVRLEASACDRFVALTIEGIDPRASSPAWLERRVVQAGMRSISLAVDVTNYVMLETGQPLHAYDADKLAGPLVVRFAREGETLVTLDGARRELGPDDLLICDDSGPIGLAGVMGGASTEVDVNTRRIVLEAAHFDAVTVARAARRHQLTSEASRRFERGVDPAATLAAAERAAQLLTEHGGGTVAEARTVLGEVAPRRAIAMPADLPARVLGRELGLTDVLTALEGAGSHVTALGDALTVTPPTWRPDLVDPIDLVEEVGRKTGLDAVAPRLPRATGGRGLTAEQRYRRELGAALAAQGLVEVATMPFVSDAQLDALAVPADDPRRRLVRLANPLSDEFPALRSTLLPGLVEAAQRNASRSQDDVALFEIGRVFLQTVESGELAAPAPGVDQRPDEGTLAQLDRSLPDQPRHVAALLAGAWQDKDWRSALAPEGWELAFALADQVAERAGVLLARQPADEAPWHPGRCAALLVDGVVVGHAGELHPSVCRAVGLPARAGALEMDLRALLAQTPQARHIGAMSRFPVVKEDVALVVPADVAAGEVQQALQTGGGELLESVQLFDVYVGDQVGEGMKSLAYALRFRAQDRTLTQAEATAAKEAAVAAAVAATGGSQRV